MARIKAKAIVWFKRDLRVVDHRPLIVAAEAGAIVPLYIVEPGLWRQPDASARQWAFIAESLAELDAALTALGAPLHVEIGEAAEVLAGVVQRHKAGALYSHEETGNGWTFARDRRVAAWARGTGVAWHEFRQSGVVRRLASRDRWASQWDAFMAQPVLPPPATLAGVARRGALRLPTAAELGLGDDAPQRQPGGRAAGLHLLDSFLTARAPGYQRAMSSPVAGEWGCSRLSPHLAYGTLSMRETHQATLRRRAALTPDDRGYRPALAAFDGRLHWHCHFMQKLESEPAIERRAFHPALDDLRRGSWSQPRHDDWAAGETGYPFLDACMRQLNATGWINFRMRAMLASFASYHLWLDWRGTGPHLARAFTDYEPGIHWSQMQMQSGTTGINTLRIYSPVKQSVDQDASGDYIRRWVPELADLPPALIHEPWRVDGATLAAHGVRLGGSYPAPIVEHAEAVRHARAAFAEVYRRPEFAALKAAVYTKHGSRAPGRAQRERPFRPRKKTATQLALSLGD